MSTFPELNPRPFIAACNGRHLYPGGLQSLLTLAGFSPWDGTLPRIPFGIMSAYLFPESLSHLRRAEPSADVRTSVSLEYAAKLPEHCLKIIPERQRPPTDSKVYRCILNLQRRSSVECGRRNMRTPARLFPVLPG